MQWWEWTMECVWTESWAGSREFSILMSCPFLSWPQLLLLHRHGPKLLHSDRWGENRNSPHLLGEWNEQRVRKLNAWWRVTDYGFRVDSRKADMVKHYVKVRGHGGSGRGNH